MSAATRYARPAGSAFSPLDEELGLTNCGLTPRLQQNLARLSTWMPFARASSELAYLTGTRVSTATPRRLSEQAGADWVGVQDQQAQTILEQHPAAPEGPDLQLLSVDGARVPLVAGEWAEVKTLAIGEVSGQIGKDGESQVKAVNLSYFSRLSEASDFTEQALVETHRRGVEKAGKVCAVTDGAVWEQGFIDYHRTDAVRILDFAHASEYVADCGRWHYEEESQQFKKWFEQQCSGLKRGDPGLVLKEMRRLKRRSQRKGDEQARSVIEASLAYLEKRREMIEYAQFQLAGYPIGSGCVESANKVVVESRLKQAGMRWQRENVDAMLGLRKVACNQRWEEAWPQISHYNQQQVEKSRQQRRERKLAQAGGKEFTKGESERQPKAARKELRELVKEKKEASSQGKQPYRPPADHPWRRMRIGRARYQAIV